MPTLTRRRDHDATGAYVFDDGTFTTTQIAAVPEPST
jgi:hypothetical protein